MTASFPKAREELDQENMSKRSSIAKVTEAAANVTGRRFCSHHSGEVATDEGSFVTRNRSRRWICFREKSKIRRAEISATKIDRCSAGQGHNVQPGVLGIAHIS